MVQAIEEQGEGRANPPTFSATPSAIAWFARHRPDAIAVRDGDKAVSFRQFATDLDRCVQWLGRRSIPRGMMIGIEWRPRRYEMLLLLLACDVLDVAATVLSEVEIEDSDPILSDCALLLLRTLPAESVGTAWFALPAELEAALHGLDARPGHLRLLSRPLPPDGTMRKLRTPGGVDGEAFSREMMQRAISARMDLIPLDMRERVRALCLYDPGEPPADAWLLGFLQSGGFLHFARETEAAGLLSGGDTNYAVLMVADAERIARLATPGGARPDLVVHLIDGAASDKLCDLVLDRLAGRVTADEIGSEPDPRVEIEEARPAADEVEPPVLALLEAQLREVPGISDAVIVRPEDADAGGELVVAVEIPAGVLPPHLATLIASVVHQQFSVFRLLPLPWFPRSEGGDVQRDVLIDLIHRRRT